MMSPVFNSKCFGVRLGDVAGVLFLVLGVGDMALFGINFRFLLLGGFFCVSHSVHFTYDTEFICDIDFFYFL